VAGDGCDDNDDDVCGRPLLTSGDLDLTLDLFELKIGTLAAPDLETFTLLLVSGGSSPPPKKKNLGVLCSEAFTYTGVTANISHRPLSKALGGRRLSAGASTPLSARKQPSSKGEPLLLSAPFHFPPLTSPLLPSKNPDMGSGERCRLPKLGPGRSPACKRIFTHFRALRTHLMATFSVVYVHSK